MEFRPSLQQSVGGADVEPLQDYFAEKVAGGEKDDEAKSAIYWITHRYFDNGGDIYEIYDFIQERPAIAFLNDAEALHPEIFAGIKAREVANSSLDSLLALLAYYEIIDRDGYGDLALWGMAANRYAELAYQALNFDKRRQIPEADYEAEQERAINFVDYSISKAQYFVELSKEFLFANTRETGTINDLNKLEVIPDDLLVGLNQYAAAIENLKSAGVVIYSPFTTSEIYEFNYELAKTKVPRLYFFTNYLYASSLVYGGGATAESVALPLSRAVEYTQTTDRAEWRKSVSRVINAKTADEPGMYAYETVKTLASLSPEFKAWLTKEGWTESDF